VLEPGSQPVGDASGAFSGLLADDAANFGTNVT